MTFEEYCENKNKLSCVYEYITPEVASEMLSHNVRNPRKMNIKRMIRYSKIMIKGLWKTNGQTISFYENGDLFDGQTRLTAIIKSGVPQGLHVIRNIPNDVKETDLGGVRSISDITDGKVNNTLSGAIRIIFGGFNNNTMEKVMIAEYYDNNPEVFNKAFKACYKGADNSILRKAPCVAAIVCGIVLHVLDDEELDAFCKITNSVLPLDGYESTAPLLLNKTLKKGFKKEDGTHKENHSSDKDIFEVTFKAMKAFRKREKPKRYTLNGDCESIIESTRRILNKDGENVE